MISSGLRSKPRVDHTPRAVARAAHRDHSALRGAMVGVASALILMTQAPADAIAPKFPSAEEQRAQVEAQAAKLDALLERQMAKSNSGQVTTNCLNDFAFPCPGDT